MVFFFPCKRCALDCFPLPRRGIRNHGCAKRNNCCASRNHGHPRRVASFTRRGISDNHARSACITPFLHRLLYITEGYVCDVWAIDLKLCFKCINRLRRLIDCLRLYKEGNALPPTGVIDLKLRFKCIKNKVFDRLKTAGF